MDKLISQVLSDYEWRPPRSVLKLLEECKNTNKANRDFEKMLSDLSKTQESIQRVQQEFKSCKEEVIRLQIANDKLTETIKNRRRYEIRRSSAPNKKSTYKPSINRNLKVPLNIF